MYDNNFVGRINQLWFESGLTITKFADKCGVSRQSMQYYIDGERNPDSVRVKKICDACSVSADWLLALTDIRSLSVDAQTAVKYTRLPEDTIERIRVSYSQTQINALADLVNDEMFSHLLDDYSLFLSLLSQIENYHEFAEESMNVTEEKKVVMSFSRAKSLIASQVSNDLVEICRHKERAAMIDLISAARDDDEDGKEDHF